MKNVLRSLLTLQEVNISLPAPELRILCMFSHLSLTTISEMGFIILFLLLGKIKLPRGNMIFLHLCSSFYSPVFFVKGYPDGEVENTLRS